LKGDMSLHLCSQHSPFLLLHIDPLPHLCLWGFLPDGILRGWKLLGRLQLRSLQFVLIPSLLSSL
jgi:hypothetical protein